MQRLRCFGMKIQINMRCVTGQRNTFIKLDRRSGLHDGLGDREYRNCFKYVFYNVFRFCYDQLAAVDKEIRMV